MKVFVATPAYKDVTIEYAQSLFHAGLYCKERNIELIPQIMLSSCFVDIARSVLVKKFLETDCTHLFFVDADIGFESHAISGLVEAGVPVAVGVYRKREPKLRFAAQIHEPQEFKGPWLRMDRAATGFMCIERRVLVEMSGRVKSCKVAKEGWVPMVFDTKKEGTFVGEDYCFCDDYTKLFNEGVFDQPIWAYPDINFNHAGYEGNLYNALEAEEKRVQERREKEEEVRGFG